MDWLDRVFDLLEAEQICYCVLRNGDRLAPLPPGSRAGDPGQPRGGPAGVHCEVDLLVEAGQLPRLGQLLARLGFVRLHRRGYFPHHFFIGYDASSDRWWKLDVVTQVAYGRPVHSLATPWGERCLLRRRRAGRVFVPAPEDELLTLLLHCILDKRQFPSRHRQRLQTLRQQMRDGHELERMLHELAVPGLSWARIGASIEQDANWDQLLDLRRPLARRLARGRRLAILLRQVGDRLLRRLDRGARLLRPEALGVALLAPDGAGKTTLAAAIREHFFFPVRQVYMGLYQRGGSPPKLLRWGLPGKLLVQWGRYLAARYHRARGRLVLFDRYTYDALLPARQSLTRRRRLRQWLLAHACPAPDLVLILDAPGQVLYGRKAEHTAADLEQQRQAYLALQPALPHSRVIDGAQQADQVRRQVTAAIWNGYQREGSGR